MKILPFIMAGGAGYRLWPASSSSRPKQFLPLADPLPLIRHAYLRISGMEGAQPPVILTSEKYQSLVRQCLPEVEPGRIWCEPQGRNTGPCIAWAVHETQESSPGAVAVFLPADHLFRQEDAAREAIRRAAVAVSRGDRIALLGIRPDRPETGFGYIQAEGDSLCSGLLQVRRFLEKPDAGLARELAKRPDTYWNSGIFIVPLAAARRIIQESSAVLGDFMASLPPPGTSRLPGQTGRERLVGAFAGVEPVPFDSAVLEKSRKTVLLPVEAGWSDLGSWEAILESSPRDERGNSISDGSLAVEAEGCLLKAEKGRIVALGVRDLIVISWGESVLVCPRDRAQEVRNLVASLPPEGSPPSTKRGGMK